MSHQSAACGFWRQEWPACPPRHNSAKLRCNHTLRYCWLSLRGVAPEAVLQAVEEDAYHNSSAHPRSMPGLDSFSAPYSLRVRFFGRFEVLCNDEVVPLGCSGKAMTILKYLLARRSRPVSQDHLMGWLWPESNLKKARWYLNSAIYGLRKLLANWPHLADCPKHLLLEDGRRARLLRVWCVGCAGLRGCHGPGDAIHAPRPDPLA
jgi:hypothetical protein